MPWLGLGATLAWNLHRHRRGKSTICSITRRVLPKPRFLLGWGVFSWVMIRHILNGYIRDAADG
jgi:hypothetical protein